ncbi:MAG: ABC transporter permease subunit [Gemmatimonadaceae bacterium]|nr:ABC transporter permease subunit [Gemmatimonadaceae bacterium]
MTGTVFRHQLLADLRCLRFRAGLAVLLLAFAANGVIYAVKTANLAEEAARINELNEERYGWIESPGHAVAAWYKIRGSEVGTEFMAEAGSNWFMYAMILNPASGEIPHFSSSRTTNRWMRPFEVADWSVIVRCVLSFLCILLAYNAVSGERESGTLRLALAGPLSLRRFLFTKVGAHLTALMAAAGAGSLLSLLILLLGGAVKPDGILWLSWLFFLLTTAVLAALLLLAAAGISALARSSASSLVILATGWTVLMVVVPQSSHLAAVTAVESPWAVWRRMGEHEQEVRTAMQREGLKPRPLEVARSDDYDLEKRYVQRLDELEREKMRRVEEMVFIRQLEVARAVNLLSPGGAFQYSLEALLRNGIQRFRSFARQGWDYRETLREFLRAKDAEDPESPHLLFLGGFMSQKKLDSAEIPRFQEVPLSLRESLAAGVVPILLLVVETALALVFALWAFGRAEATPKRP